MKVMKSNLKKANANFKTLLTCLTLVLVSFYHVNAQTQNEKIIINRPSGNLGLKLKNTSAGIHSPHLTFDARSDRNNISNVFIARQEGNNLAFRRFKNDFPFEEGRLLMYMKANGNIGVFQGNPQERFHVNGNVRSDKQFLVRGRFGKLAQQSYFGNDGINHRIELRTGKTPYIDFKNDSGPIDEDYDMRLILNNNNTLSVQGGGLAIDAAIVPSGYRLAVNGKVLATSMKIQDVANWPDYVFEDSYELTSLDKLEEFISKNGHLPNVPSAAQVTSEEGIDIAVMNKVLLEKVEELTLYTIEQEKQLAAQKAQLDALMTKVNNLISKQ